MDIIKPKCGDINASGMVYWDTLAACGERWITPEKFQAWREKKRIRTRKYLQTERGRHLDQLSKKRFKMKNPSAQREYDKKQRLKNREAMDERRKRWAAKNPEKVKAAAARSRSTLEKRRVIYKKTASDPMAKLRMAIRDRMRSAIKRNGWSKGGGKTPEYLGCDWERVRNHLEKQFREGMGWHNHGFYGWHIDHIMPLSSAKTIEELIPLLHYTNLQPLWASENMKKWAFIPKDHFKK